MTPNQIKRFNAIRKLVVDATDGNYEVGMTASDILTRIRELRGMGKTERWLDTIDGWYRMVERDQDEDLAWALHQGAIFANYAK